MDTFIFIQARQGSSRFRNKVLSKIDGIELVKIQYKRLLKVKSKKKIIFLIPKKNNKDLKSFLNLNKINFFAGEEKDVLSRYYNAAKKYKSKNIIRLTGDCPLIDYRLIDKLIKSFFEGKADYMSNTINRSFPHGMDMEIFTFNTLKKIKKLAHTRYDKEHVTSFLTKNKNKFLIKNFTNYKNEKNYRITVDFVEDLEVIKEIIKFYNGNIFISCKQIVECLKKKRNIGLINSMHKIY